MVESALFNIHRTYAYYSNTSVCYLCDSNKLIKMSGCYNCQSLLHRSRDCDKRQRFTRCPVCDNVCVGPNSHKIWCTNKSFVSQLIDTASTVAITMHLKIGFKGVSNVFVADGENYVPINGPLFVANFNGFIYKEEKRLVCAVTNPATESVRLNIIDGQGNAFMHLELFDDAFIVNDRYRIHDDGSIEYNPFNMGLVQDAQSIKLKVEAVEFISLDCTISKLTRLVCFSLILWLNH